MESFHAKSKFLTNYNFFWVIQNCDPIVDKLDNVNYRCNAKQISTYDFSTLYTKLPHDKLIKRLSDLIDFIFKGGDKKHIILSNKGKAYWGSNVGKKHFFSKTSLKIATKHLISNCFFTVGNMTMQQTIGIPMGIDPAPFWANLFLYTYERDYMKSLIGFDKVKAKCFHSTHRFIDDLCAINDGGEFGRIYRDIYPDELNLKEEHSGVHASFLNLYINLINYKFIYNLYDKRDAFTFSIVRMPHISSNIPQSIFYSSLVGEFLRIAHSTLLLQDFIPRVN